MSAGLQGAIESAPVSRLHEQRSYDPADFAVPGGREEEWRFTPLRRLRGLHTDTPPATTATVTVEVDPAPEVKTFSAERAVANAGRTFIPADRISARAYASSDEATVIAVPAEADASRPTVVTVTGHGGAGYGHLLVQAEPFSRAVIVLDYRGSATYADNVELVVGDGASLSVVSVADWADDAVHVSHHYATLGRDARLRHAAVTLGGSVVRLGTEVRYDGPGGDAELTGLYFADAGQHLEHRLFVDHDVPNCRSRVTYKGALQGEGAHAVWIGDVLIRPEATGTDTYEYNRNLVLTDGTRVDSVPNLEILTGEIIGAGHASASGRLEDHHLFYLMARGIPYEEARKLVIRGFFGQLIDTIAVPELRDRIAEAIEAELTKSLLATPGGSGGSSLR
jgi:Fe-S cluster assembly protein SufD